MKRVHQAVIKMLIEGRSPNVRHVSRTLRVNLDWVGPFFQNKHFPNKHLRVWNPFESPIFESVPLSTCQGLDLQDKQAEITQSESLAEKQEVPIKGGGCI